jgi:DNA-directed RNA polymerase subunit F
MRDTSIKAWEELLASGFLETQKGIVYRLLEQNGPSTQREIEAIHEKETNGNTILVPRSSRFSELERDGLIKATGQRACTITGRSALVWSPDPGNKLVSIKKQSKSEEIKHLKSILKQVSKATSLEEVRLIVEIINLSNEPKQKDH